MNILSFNYKLDCIFFEAKDDTFFSRKAADIRSDRLAKQLEDEKRDFIKLQRKLKDIWYNARTHGKEVILTMALAEIVDEEIPKHGGWEAYKNKKYILTRDDFINIVKRLIEEYDHPTREEEKLHTGGQSEIPSRIYRIPGTTDELTIKAGKDDSIIRRIKRISEWTTRVGYNKFNKAFMAKMADKKKEAQDNDIKFQNEVVVMAVKAAFNYALKSAIEVIKPSEYKKPKEGEQPTLF